MAHRGAIVVLVACALVAAASLLVPSAPTTDPWGWILWGQETAHLDLDTELGGSPSWKPLPVAFTTVFSLAGSDGAPVLWLWLARTGGLIGLVVAYRVGSRLVRRAIGPERTFGPRTDGAAMLGGLAGLVAAGMVVFSGDWVRSMMHGYTEPLLIGLLLGAVDRHLSERRGQAFLCLAVAALARPEVFALVVAYALLAFSGRERWRWLAVSIGIPLLWIVPDWIGSGDPLHANAVADDLRGADELTPGQSLQRGLLLMGVPGLVLAVLGVVLSMRHRDRTVTVLSMRHRDRTVTVLAAVAASMFLGIFVLMLLGYPTIERFYVVAGCFLSVLAGCGVGLALAEVPGARLRLGATLAAGLAALAAVALAASDLAAAGRAAARRAEVQGELRELADGLPRRWQRGTTTALPRGLNWNKVALAWELGERPRRIVALTTDARAYLTSVEDGDDARYGPPGALKVYASGGNGPLLAFLPFGDARVRVKSKLRWRTQAVAASRHWRAVVLTPIPRAHRG